jgi:hypothetical protein
MLSYIIALESQRESYVRREMSYMTRQRSYSGFIGDPGRP